MGILLGCIADDFTGATDLCEILTSNGMRTIQMLGLPEEKFLQDLPTNIDAVVVSLKIRTAPVNEAVKSSLAVLDFLRKAGCRQYFWKYCSTFDSTSQGNIGPVADALQDALGVRASIVCPAFPENGRTVYQGHLFVYNTLLQNTHMRYHPLTPMLESDLLKLLRSQTQRLCCLLPFQDLNSGLDGAKKAWTDLEKKGCVHIVADAITSQDLHVLGELCANHKLVTGGSGIARGLPANFRKQGLLPANNENSLFEGEGVGIVLAGSCSAITLGQIHTFLSRYPGFMLDPQKLSDDGEHLKEAVSYAKKCIENEVPCLIYSSADPERVGEIQKELGRENAGALVEKTFASIALEMAQHGVRRFIIAGGETSGAVMSALNIRAIKIGKSIAPGVPWVATLCDDPLFFALKSGNFGSPEFFLKALGIQ